MPFESGDVRWHRPVGDKQSPYQKNLYGIISTHGRKLSETNPLSGTTTWAYANADERLVTSATLPDPDGSGPLTAPVTQTGYDSDGRAVTTTDPMDHTQTTTLNADGLATAVTDNLNHITQYAGASGRITIDDRCFVPRDERSI